jgi:hypothetical protein
MAKQDGCGHGEPPADVRVPCLHKLRLLLRLVDRGRVDSGDLEV